MADLNLTLNLKTRRIWWAPNNACKWQMGFNSAFKGLLFHFISETQLYYKTILHFNLLTGRQHTGTHQELPEAHKALPFLSHFQDHCWRKTKTSLLQSDQKVCAPYDCTVMTRCGSFINFFLYSAYLKTVTFVNVLWRLAITFTLPLTHNWLRRRAISRKVAGSIPDGVTGIFHWHNPSGRTTGLGVDAASNRN